MNHYHCNTTNESNLLGVVGVTQQMDPSKSSSWEWRFPLSFPLLSSDWPVNPGLTYHAGWVYTGFFFLNYHLFLHRFW